MNEIAHEILKKNHGVIIIVIFTITVSAGVGILCVRKC